MGFTSLFEGIDGLSWDYRGGLRRDSAVLYMDYVGNMDFGVLEGDYGFGVSGFQGFRV